MGKRLRTLAIAFIISALLAGCGKSTIPTDAGTDTLILDKNGKVTWFLTDSFEEDYYSIDELRTMAVSEAEALKDVTVDNVAMSSIDPSRVVVTYGFTDLEAYNSCTGGDTAIGTVKELVVEGYSVNVSLKSVKDGSVFTQSDIMADADKHMLISKEAQIFYVPYTAAYVSDGVEILPDGGIDASGAEGTVYILFRK